MTNNILLWLAGKMNVVQEQRQLTPPSAGWQRSEDKEDRKGRIKIRRKAMRAP